MRMAAPRPVLLPALALAVLLFAAVPAAAQSGMAPNGASPGVLHPDAAAEACGVARNADVPLPPDLLPVRQAFADARCLEAEGALDAAAAAYADLLQTGGLAEGPRVAAGLGVLRTRAALGRHEAAAEALVPLTERIGAVWGLHERLRETLTAITDPSGAEGNTPPPEARLRYLRIYAEAALPAPEDAELLERLLALARQFGRAALQRDLPVKLWRQPADRESAERWSDVPDSREGAGYHLLPNDYLLRARRLYDLRLFDLLAEELEALPLPAVPPETRRELGRIYFRALLRLREHHKAVVQVNDPALLERFAFDERQRLIWELRAQQRRRNIRSIIKRVADLEALAPQDAELPAVFLELVRYNAQRGDWPTLVYWAERITQDFPQSPQAADAYWLVAWHAYEQGDLERMLTWLQRGIAAGESFHPVDRARLHYWKGRAHALQGEQAAAEEAWATVRERWPYGIYAELAAMARDGGSFALQPHPPEPDGALGAPRPAPEALWRVAGAREGAFYEAVGERHLARQNLLQVLLGSLPRPAVEEMAALLSWLGRHDLQLRLIANHRLGELRDQRPHDSPLFRQAYPRPHWPVVREQARAQGLDPFFVLAIMREESRFITDADSRVGARGLMQLMPSTAEWMADRHGLAYDPATLHEPEMNIPLGAAYLRRMVQRFPEHPHYAVAAYNAGPGTVSRWQERLGSLPLDEFVERVPYRETQNYVKRVVLSYLVYRRLYGHEAGGDGAS